MLVTVILPDSSLGFRTYTNKREWEIVLALCGTRDYGRECEIKPVIFYSKPYVTDMVPIKYSFNIQFHFSIGVISLQGGKSFN